MSNWFSLLPMLQQRQFPLLGNRRRLPSWSRQGLAELSSME
jgi:hypothetical protein